MNSKDNNIVEDNQVINVFALENNFKIKKLIPSTIKNINKNDTMIISYGSYFTKCGYNYNHEPLLICPSVSTRVKRSNEEIILSGNNLNTDNIKSSYKNIFELSMYSQKIDRFQSQNTTLNFNHKLMDFNTFEDFNDYIMNELNYDKSKCNGLIVGELLGIKKWRNHFLEILFEAYEFNKIFPVCDILILLYNEIFYKIKDKIFDVNYYQNVNNYILKRDLIMSKDFKVNKELTCCMVHIGNTKIHFVLVLNGCILYSHIRRINMGLNNSKNLLKTSLSLKYLHLKNKINSKSITLLIENVCEVAEDYNNQLKYLYEGPAGFKLQNNVSSYIKKNAPNTYNLKNHIYLQFLENDAEVFKFKEEQAVSKIKRQEQAKKMSEFMKLKKEERKKANYTQLELLERVLSTSTTDPKLFKEELANLQINTKDDLLKKIKNLKIKLNLISQEELLKERFDLIHKDNSELTEEQIKAKNIQLMHKQKHDNSKLRKEEKIKKLKKIEEMKRNNPNLYVNKLLKKKNQLKEKIKKIKSFKEDKSFKIYREKRIFYLYDSYLEGKITQEEYENDPIIKDFENTSDCEKYETKVFEIDNEIRTVNPDYEDEDVSLYNYYLNCQYINFSVERFKCFEIFFKPYLIGSNQQGLSELIITEIRKFPESVQKCFLSNILIKGGGAKIKGLKERLIKDIKSDFSPDSEINIKLSDDPLNEGYLNMYEISKNNWNDFAITKEEYHEHGPFYSKPFILSNFKIIN